MGAQTPVILDTPHWTTGETPFKLTYGVDAMIPVEVGEPITKVVFWSKSSESIREEIDLSSKAREMVHIRERALKQKVTRRYNPSVVPCKFEQGGLVLQRTNIGPLTPSHRKLASNWEGPYKVIKVLGKRAYKLSTLSGSQLSRSWDNLNLRKFYVWTMWSRRTLFPTSGFFPMAFLRKF